MTALLVPCRQNTLLHFVVMSYASEPRMLQVNLQQNLAFRL